MSYHIISYQTASYQGTKEIFAFLLRDKVAALVGQPVF